MLAKAYKVQKYKLARNINQRRVFTCPYMAWNMLMDHLACYRVWRATTNHLHNFLLSQQILVIQLLMCIYILYTYVICITYNYNVPINIYVLSLSLYTHIYKTLMKIQIYNFFLFMLVNPLDDVIMQITLHSKAYQNLWISYH